MPAPEPACRTPPSTTHPPTPARSHPVTTSTATPTPPPTREHALLHGIAPGPGAAKLAEQARTRFLSEVDERRNPRTKATVSQLLDKWFKAVDIEPTTRRAYSNYIEKHIRPVLGHVQVARL
jgi:integrase